ncbi:MAG: transcription antitermination factor NusB [Saprospiraceae bacterium]
MQLLFAERQNEGLDAKGTLTAFRKMVDQSYKTLLFDLYVMCKVLAEARDEKKRRAVKMVKTEADAAFKSHIYDNPLTLALSNSEDLLRFAERHNFAELIDEERLRSFYEIAKGWEGYEEFATQKEPTLDSCLGALLKAHKALMDSDGYNDFLEDRFARWDEDKSLVVGSAKKILKGLPLSESKLHAYQTDSETRQDFGEHLLMYVLDNDTELIADIEPVIENWDIERVAVLDMVLLKMALSELFEFTQIPMKVTLNEYVELAKTYSTDKSKEFINGILDKLMHKLQDEGKIVKKGRGLKE